MWKHCFKRWVIWMILICHWHNQVTSIMWVVYDCISLGIHAMFWKTPVVIHHLTILQGLFPQRDWSELRFEIMNRGHSLMVQPGFTPSPFPLNCKSHFPWAPQRSAGCAFKTFALLPKWARGQEDRMGGGGGGAAGWKSERVHVKSCTSSAVVPVRWRIICISITLYSGTPFPVENNGNWNIMFQSSS